MSYQEKCKHEFVGYNICCYCGFCKNYNGEIVSPYIAANVQQVCDDFEKWYFAIKQEHGNPPLAMQIFYWFSQHPIPPTSRTDSKTPEIGGIESVQKMHELDESLLSESPAKPEGEGAFIDKHMKAIKGKMKHYKDAHELSGKLIDKHIKPLVNGLQKASVEYFLEKGTISGAFYEALTSMIFELFSDYEAAAHSPAGEGKLFTLEDIRVIAKTLQGVSNRGIDEITIELFNKQN